MKGDAQLNQALNQVLKESLTAINQYFLHARMLGDWGFEQLEKHDYEASIHAMKEADRLIKRILFLEGLPNLQDLGKLLIGEDAIEVIKNDLDMERRIHETLTAAIAQCEQGADYISREHLEKLLDHNEERIDWGETQLSLIEDIGSQNYLQAAMQE